jgi:tetratricopeptide (TPR) repeat protein
VAERTDDTASLIAAYRDLGHLYLCKGDLHRAISVLERGLGLCQHRDIPAYCPIVAALLGSAYALPGYPAEALPLLEQAKDRGYQAYALRLLGEIAARHEPPEVEEAQAHYHQALALTEEPGMRPLQAHCHYGLGTLYANTGRPEMVRTELSTVIALYRSIDMTFWLPQAAAALEQVSE